MATTRLDSRSHSVRKSVTYPYMNNHSTLRGCPTVERVGLGNKGHCEPWGKGLEAPDRGLQSIVVAFYVDLLFYEYHLLPPPDLVP
jgi:hypothetical protein